MNKNALVSGAVLGLLSVMIGAFGAHALKDILLTNGRMDVYETAVKYQFYHAIVLLIVGMLAEKLQGPWVKRATFCFAGGVVVFSGSLYVLSVTNMGWLGAITPVGGLLLICGWACLLIGIMKID
ncbi:Uncharacterized membrane protein YgdD, TMEM256/DUF423 family [Reichenbachiella faecimaris]|uniref:Uncharacterized membrane protein YgdD, TMEM256/DUF423 family n=1 Tax=Reichenbachiella faecimaris TaxID=692418 RepID=A0A1W2G7B3_REIFA|nr:DUF423 domain-containing protein [Reichenbachiella faecimaris]SMD32513.1 Uncharacterized membrane protein YgdD, TMEM256/DUF423 family [Reichenbachiella faecimaris]